MSTNSFGWKRNVACLKVTDVLQMKRKVHFVINSISLEKKDRKNILDNNVAASPDAAKLSDRKAAIVLTTTLKSVRCDPSEYNVNKSSIRLLRMKSRENRAQDLKKSSQLIFLWPFTGMGNF
ncbi:hypothetical protein AVEN_18571-1 [Araneus ventricosus]|uniref:Uncharacterized protein n=1 Tax=Araneus ventricosus TaxID=182803 RepID=A0A4Y2L603_ARAVE|nr:hypothetical protein AVEN_18571-1 [Araneus ventricosus]